MILPPLLHSRVCSTRQLSPFKKQRVETALKLNYTHDFLNIHFKRQVSSHAKSLSKIFSPTCKKEIFIPLPRDLFKYTNDFFLFFCTPLLGLLEGWLSNGERQRVHLIKTGMCSPPKRHCHAAQNCHHFKKTDYTLVNKRHIALLLLRMQRNWE